MDLRGLVQTVATRWLLVLLVASAGLAMAGGVTLLMTPLYEARTYLFITARSGPDDIGQLTQGSVFSQQRVKSYTQLVTNPEVIERVIADLDLDVTIEDLSERVSARVPLDTVLIEISARDESPTQAAAIADAAAVASQDLIARLETASGAEESPVTANIVRPADVPTEPVSPKPLVNLAVGLLLGLGVGVGLAVARQLADTTITSESDVRDQGIPVLGDIAFDPTAAQEPLVRGAATHSPRAEAVRHLRTNLQFVDVDTPPKVILFTSALPAEGKTVTTCTLAQALAEAGKRVILVEGDLRRPRVATYFGVEGGAGLTSILIGKADLADVLQPVGPNLEILTSGAIPPNPSELLGSQHMVDLLQELRERSDVVVVDAPPLLPVTDAAILGALCDGVVVVVRHGSTRRDHLAGALDALRSVDARVFGAVITMSPPRRRGTYAYSYDNAPQPSAARSGWRRRSGIEVQPNSAAR